MELSNDRPAIKAFARDFIFAEPGPMLSTAALHSRMPRRLVRPEENGAIHHRLVAAEGRDADALGGS
jgi:hypothetical protein